MSFRLPPDGAPAPRLPSMTRAALGDALARLVWENLSDDLADPEFEVLFRGLEVPVEHGIPGERAFEELLIFHLWVHTRAVQLGLRDRTDAEGIGGVLDHMHRAVFEDMVESGTPRANLAAFEDRTVKRYAEYHRQVREGDEVLGAAVVRHLAGTNRPLAPRAIRFVALRALEASRPLRDFLEEIELVAED
jgi:hypothetical protein